MDKFVPIKKCSISLYIVSTHFSKSYNIKFNVYTT